MPDFVADLHVHIGRSGSGRPVKITASRDLTFENIAMECADRKGIDVVGVVDCASPPVIADIEALIASGEMIEQPDGGLRYRDQVTVILGAEFETREPEGGMSHHVSYFPGLRELKAFSAELSRHVTNMELSSQACGLPAKALMIVCLRAGGVFVPAHCFTPHKSVYGACTRRLADLFENLWPEVFAIELGLSADSYLADRIAELADRAFLSNSDAHSLPKIGREYNIIRMQDATFAELVRALKAPRGAGAEMSRGAGVSPANPSLLDASPADPQAGRLRHADVSGHADEADTPRIIANYGLDPRLGKYHRTFCEDCQWIAQGPPPLRACEQCGSLDTTFGVLDRIAEIADYDEPQPPAHRPPYFYQVPLQFVPGVGAVALNRLINRFGSEMAVLHKATERELGETVGAKVTKLILAAREGTLPLQAGGGGHYGKAVPNATGQLSLPDMGKRGEA
jgi:PHP family Zn ribbon phosphoesterase